MDERFENGELETASAIAIKDTTKYYTDNGHVVFGGGGIIPDQFVPLDTALMKEGYLRS
ncbi:MAG: hypothetical protein R2795_00905 [Saprospiraceae bacterium]